MEYHQRLLVGIVVIAVVAGGVLAAFQVLREPSPGTVPATAFDASYDESSEILTITLVGGDTLTGERVEAVTIVRSNEDGDGTSEGVELRVRDRRVDHHVWAANGEPRATTLPLEHGSSIQVVETGVDWDGDGRTGVDGKGIRVVLHLGDGNSLTVEKWRIEDDRAVTPD